MSFRVVYANEIGKAGPGQFESNTRYKYQPELKRKFPVNHHEKVDRTIARCYASHDLLAVADSLSPKRKEWTNPFPPNKTMPAVDWNEHFAIPTSPGHKRGLLPAMFRNTTIGQSAPHLPSVLPGQTPVPMVVNKQEKSASTGTLQKISDAPDGPLQLPELENHLKEAIQKKALERTAAENEAKMQALLEARRSEISLRLQLEAKGKSPEEIKEALEKKRTKILKKTKVCARPQPKQATFMSGTLGAPHSRKKLVEERHEQMVQARLEQKEKSKASRKLQEIKDKIAYAKKLRKQKRGERHEREDYEEELRLLREQKEHERLIRREERRQQKLEERENYMEEAEEQSEGVSGDESDFDSRKSYNTPSLSSRSPSPLKEKKLNAQNSLPQLPPLELGKGEKRELHRKRTKKKRVKEMGDTWTFLKTYSTLAQAAPRRPKWERDPDESSEPERDVCSDGEVHKLKCNLSKVLSFSGVKNSEKDNRSSEDCGRRVSKLIGNLKDLRLQFTDLKKNFESVTRLTSVGHMASVDRFEQLGGKKMCDDQKNAMLIKMAGTTSGLVDSLQQFKGRYTQINQPTCESNASEAGPGGIDFVTMMSSLHNIPKIIVKTMWEMYPYAERMQHPDSLNEESFVIMMKALPWCTKTQAEKGFRALMLAYPDSDRLVMNDVFAWVHRSFEAEWQKMSAIQLRAKMMMISNSVEKKTSTG